LWKNTAIYFLIIIIYPNSLFKIKRFDAKLGWYWLYIFLVCSLSLRGRGCNFAVLVVRKASHLHPFMVRKAPPRSKHDGYVAFNKPYTRGFSKADSWLQISFDYLLSWALKFCLAYGVHLRYLLRILLKSECRSIWCMVCYTWYPNRWLGLYNLLVCCWEV